MLVQLDNKDKAILRHLQKEGRTTNKDLAAVVDLSAPPCLRRVEKLEKAGFIKGYHAELDCAALGFTITAFMRVQLTNKEVRRREFENFARRASRIVECYSVAGGDDYLLKVVAKHWADYQAFQRDLQGLAYVAKVHTSTVVGVPKQAYGPPV